MTTLTLQPDSTAGIDTTLREFAPTFNYGTDTSITVGFDTSSSKKRRGLIKFNLSSIPAGSIIVSAVVTLVMTSEIDPTDQNIKFHRSLVAWFEGIHNGSAPGAGEDGSTWNNKNANGSTTWGAVGGLAGTDYTSSATATTLITGTGSFTWNVAANVQSYVNGTATNYGWWLINATESGAVNSVKTFASSDNATAGNRPKLVVVYYAPIAGTANGASTVSGTLKAKGNISGLAIGQSTVEGTATSNAIQGSSAGTSTVSGTLGAGTHMFGPTAGVSTVTGILKGKGSLRGVVAGTSSATAEGNFAGEMRGQSAGVASVIATGHVYARHIAPVQGCEINPLFYITDGALKENGQLNRLNLIDSRIGFILDDWKPNIAQYKEGGTFSDSPYGTGRRLVRRVFTNAIEVLNMKCRGHTQDDLIWHTRQFFHFQESAADFWTGNWPDRPIYIVAKAPKETNIRYAIIHVMSAPELENPYAFNVNPASGKPTLESFIMRIERGDWMSNPPRESECVAISSRRSWTIASWIT